MNFSELLEKHGQPVMRSRGEYLFRQGEQDTAVYFIRSGLLKAYYLSEDGKENIKSFLLPGDAIGSLKGFFGEDGCSFNLVCLQDCALISLNFQVLYEESRKHLTLANEVVDFLIKFAMKKENREFELLCLAPEQRYIRILEQAPELVEKLPQIEIARFLGVTPVGLSRIKKRVLATD